MMKRLDKNRSQGLDTMKLYGDRTGLRINIVKIKAMCINPTKNGAFSLDGKDIAQV